MVARSISATVSPAPTLSLEMSRRASRKIGCPASSKSRLDRTDKGCSTCRIRNLCSGGCYHESYAHFGDPLKPAYHYCDLMRDWVDFGIEVYGDLIATNPQYFHDHIAPRKANHK